MEAKRRLRDMTGEEIRAMTPEDMLAHIDRADVWITEYGEPWTPKSFGPRVYERWRRRFFRLLQLLRLRRRDEDVAGASG